MGQRIAYIPQSFFPDTSEEYDLYLLPDTGAMDAAPEFGERELVEDDPDCLQIISVATLVSPSRSEVLVVEKRGDKATIEADKALLWIGGHADEEDCAYSLLGTAANAVSRELYEEIGLAVSPDEVLSCSDVPLAIRCSHPEKSRKHLAVCFVLECDLAQAMSGFNGSELKGAVAMPWQDVPYDLLEPWGKAIYSYLCG